MFLSDFKYWKSVFWETLTENDFLVVVIFFFNSDSLHARLNSHYEALSYKEKKAQKRLWDTAGYRKSVQKEPTVKRYLSILDLKPLRSYVKGRHSIGREFQSLAQ